MKITVLAGGIGAEREVSLRSGRACFQALGRLGHEAMLLDFRGAKDVPRLMESTPELVLLALHGEGGEDGAVQGLLEWLGLPYTGSGVTASALCMDKYLSKLAFKAAGLTVAPCSLLGSKPAFNELRSEWGCEKLFIKPRCGGSSVGADIIATETEWRAVEADPGMMVEAFVPGREITVGYLRRGGKWTCLPILELKPKGRFYDYHCKYTKGQTEFLLPAPLESALAAKVADAGARAIAAAGISGYGRVDMIIAEGVCNILEINSLPGMTELSDLPAQAKAAGMSFDELVAAIVESALERR